MQTKMVGPFFFRWYDGRLDEILFLARTRYYYWQRTRPFKIGRDWRGLCERPCFPPCPDCGAGC